MKSSQAPDVNIDLPPFDRVVGHALLVTDERMVEGGDIFEAKYEIPHGVEPMSVRWVLVRVDV